MKRVARGIVGLKQEERSLSQHRNLEYSLEENLLAGAPTPKESTLCILEAILDDRVSGSCYDQETDSRAKGYTLSHQAIYFLLSSAVRHDLLLVLL